MRLSHGLWDNCWCELSHRLWDNSRFLGISQVQRPRAVDVGAGEPGPAREGFLKVGGQSVDNLGTPAFPLLPRNDFPADIPVKAYQLAAGANSRPDLGAADAALDVFQEFGVTRREKSSRLPHDF